MLIVSTHLLIAIQYVLLFALLQVAIAETEKLSVMIKAHDKHLLGVILSRLPNAASSLAAQPIVTQPIQSITTQPTVRSTAAQPTAQPTAVQPTATRPITTQYTTTQPIAVQSPAARSIATQPISTQIPPPSTSTNNAATIQAN